MGSGPANLLGNQVLKSQKLAPYVYNSDNMFKNLLSQRKTSGGKRGTKRSQPNQAGKALASQLRKMNN